jgi:hypothetical protein
VIKLSLFADPTDLNNARSPWRSNAPPGPAQHVTLKFALPAEVLKEGREAAVDYAEKVARLEAARYVDRLLGGAE